MYKWVYFSPSPSLPFFSSLPFLYVLFFNFFFLFFFFIICIFGKKKTLKIFPHSFFDLGFSFFFFLSITEKRGNFWCFFI